MERNIMGIIITKKRCMLYPGEKSKEIWDLVMTL